ENGKILNDFKLKSLQNTIDYILINGGTIVLATHIGRPQTYDPNLSTKLLVPWFKQHEYSIVFTKDLDDAYQKSKEANKQIILLENMRFFPGEKNKDIFFAKKLARLGDFYVNDAFGTLHCTDTSVTLVPEEFPSKKRTIGFLVEKELKMLNKLLSHPTQHFILIVGGKKIADKIPFIQHLLKKVNTILLCPAIVFTFLQAINKPVGNSLVDDQMFKICKLILTEAKKKKVSILFPLDFQVAKKTIYGPLTIVLADQLMPDDIGISIGPKTIKSWEPVIKQAGTIFFNGCMGFSDRTETLVGMKSLLNVIIKTKGTSIIAGGDSVAVTTNLGFDQQFDYLSTGGGAALAYLSGETLPGLVAINKNINTMDKG
ncbi:MAG: phosphoglycerate kinase, partial [Candidatus Babeliales bacterium]